VRRIEVNLDDPADVERVWAELERAHAARRTDPELRQAILCHVDEALADGRLTDKEASQIRRQLDEQHPGVVLESWWRKIVKDRPALGVFRRRIRETWPSTKRWIADDPRRLIDVMGEMGRFSRDEVRILDASGELADRAQIPDDEAQDVAVEGLKRLRRSWREQGRGRAS
jgi:hypothetical protein